ncbi:metallophosphoesterase [Conexibacter sp. DBS9H8]|uniref:metallophosphoesterase family protein n=1 Tax=Conexibacter sp. DBS9H8 TaxID=2937801 RepID=UPI00200F2BD3|nr:metallophosphoesterase [Conexibacter sp. DBS9H8]
MTARRLNRREALLAAAGGAGALLLTGCGSPRRPAADGSTLASTWVDPGTGQLQVGPGEPLRARVELGPARPVGAALARIAHLTDAHVLDASSPARVPFLARFGPPLQSTFRPQETLTVQVLAGAVHAIRAFAPELVIEGGDLVDNNQANELAHALTVLAGGTVHPGSGPDGYDGVQLSSDPDPFYYRPDIDAPRHPGLLRAAVAPLSVPGLDRPWVPVLGDHDALVAGELVPTPVTRALAVGDRALWQPPPHLHLPAGFRLNPSGSPDGPPDPRFVAAFLAQALAGPTVTVGADPTRAELAFTVADRLTAAAAGPGRPSPTVGGRLDGVRDIGAAVRLVVLDVTRRDGGSGGLVVPGQPAWLAEQLAAAGDRWVIVVTHQPLAGSTEGGERLLEVMDRFPRVVACLAGHTHRNRIAARPSPAGGYWMITTSSLIDFPQQSRALVLSETSGGGVVLDTWMLDHVDDGALGSVSRQLANLDAQGGRPFRFAGTPRDRNVRLFRRAVA